MARKMSLGTTGLCVALCLCLPAARASAEDDAVRFGPQDVRSAFHVGKSQNKNQVHYGVRLDAQCRPVGKAPVFAYWLRREKGPGITRVLSGAAVRMYGASKKQRVIRHQVGGWISMYVRALDTIWVDINITRGADQSCKATATTKINGEKSELGYAFVQLRRWNLGVKHVDLIGRRVADGAQVRQRLNN